MSIIGIPRVGEESTITCSVRHTCASAPPELILNGIPATNVIGDTLVSDWIWERTAEHTWAVKEEDQSVRCTVRYRGGQGATSELKLNVECEYNVRPCVKCFTKSLLLRLTLTFLPRSI